MREALLVAREALCEFACHGGPDIPCRRTPDQCRDQCGREAGDAIVAIDVALSPSLESPQP